MPYSVCKIFEVESGHMLSKHQDRCRFPHGHSRRIEVIVSRNELDDSDMVCDFTGLKLALHDCIDRLDHAMAINSVDPMLEKLKGVEERVIVFENTDPTTEVLARHIYDYLVKEIAAGRQYVSDRGHSYQLPADLKIERIRVSETSSTWAQYGP